MVEIIQFEYGVGSRNARIFFKDFVELFDKYGYEIYKIRSNKIDKVVYSPEMEGCQYANFLAIKKNCKYILN